LLPATPVIPSIADGVVVPIPSLPLEPKLNMRAFVEEEIANAYGFVDVPRIERIAIGVVVPPIPTLPLASTVKSEAPVEEATLNGLRLDVDVACTLKAKLDDVALIPANTPLSTSVEVPRVLFVSQRVANPIVPPDTAPTIPSDDVETHCVDDPVDQSTCPSVPVALDPS
jgi:hypothetical protein